MKPQDVLTDGAETYAEKNDDYGDSWRLAGELLWAMSGDDDIVLESVDDVIRFGLWTRRMDKMIRAFNGEFRADELNFESIFDTHKDESVYTAMHASLLED